MRFPKFTLWLCAFLLVVALTTADEDSSVTDDLPAAVEAASEDRVENAADGTEDSSKDLMEEIPEDGAEDTGEDVADDSAKDTEAVADDSAKDIETVADDSAEDTEAVADDSAKDIEAVADDSAEDTEAVAGDSVEDTGEDVADDSAEDTGEVVANDSADDTAEDAGEDVADNTAEDVAAQEDTPAETESDLPAVVPDQPETLAAETESEADDTTETAETGDGETETLITGDAKELTDDEEETTEDDAKDVMTATEGPSNASEMLPAVDGAEAEPVFTEQTKTEETSAPVAETDAPAVTPVAKAELTTTGTFKIDANKEEVNKTEVVEGESTTAPEASTNVTAALTPKTTSVDSVEMTTGVTTSPASDVVMETGSGAVARENTTTVTVPEGNATEEATKALPEKTVEDEEEEEEDVAIYEVEFYDLTEEQMNNIVTVELNSGSIDLNDAFYLGVTQAISIQLNPIKGVLTYVAPSPQGENGWMQLCIVMKVGVDGAVPKTELLAGLENVNLTSFGLAVLKMHPGMPTYGLKVMEYNDLSKEQQNAVVTLELDFLGAVLNDAFFKNVIMTLAEHYPADVSPDGSLVFVAPTPIVSMGLLQVILVSEIGEDGAVPVKDFVQTLKKLDLTAAGLEIISVKAGMPPTGIQVVELRELSMAQLEGIVTVEFNRGANTAMQNEYAIAVAVREMHGMLANEGLHGSIVFIAPTPVEDNGNLQASFIMRPAKDEAVPQDKLLESVTKMDMSKIVGVTIVNPHTGMPTYGLPVYANKDLTEAQKAAVVTIEVDTGDKTLNTFFFNHFYEASNKKILANLVNVTNGSVSYVEPTPVIAGGLMHQSVFFVTADDEEEPTVISQVKLLDALKKVNFSECEVYVRKIYAGMPAHDLVVQRSTLSETQQNNIVTMVLDSSDFRASDLHVLTRLLGAEGAKGDIVTVAPTPVEENNQLKVSIVLKQGEKGAIDQAILLNAINKIDFEVLEMSLFEAYPGMTRPTTMPPPVFPQIQMEDITGPQKDSVVTVEFEVRQGTVNDASFKAAHEIFSALLVAELNRMAQEKLKVPEVDPEASKRKRREVMEEDIFTADDVSYVEPTPRIQDGKLQFVTVVDDGKGNVASQADILAAIQNLNNTGKLPENLALVTLYGGMPADMEATVAPPAARTAAGVGDTWSSHMGLFLAIIILATICFIILIIGFMCIKYRSRRGSWSRKDDEAPIDPEPCGRKYPIVIENPIPDSEIMKDEAPMTESANPAMSYPVTKKDEDNGWVVPLDQLSPAERQKPDTENTKL